jgi:phage tail sheath protein FI
MPAQLTYPGVYIEEIPSGVHTITGVATSITAFIGRARKGPVNEPRTINGYGDFERIFGGLWKDSKLGFAIWDFFNNGGNKAIIVRLFHPYFATQADRANALDAAHDVVTAAVGATAHDVAVAARTEANLPANAAEPRKTAADTVAKAAEKAEIPGATVAQVQAAAAAAEAGAVPVTKASFTAGGLSLLAAYDGSWGENLRVSVDKKISKDVAVSMGLTEDKLFNLTIRDASPGGIVEVFRNLTLEDKPRRVDKVLKEESELLRWDDSAPIDPATNVTEADDPVTKAENALIDAKRVFPPKQADIDKAVAAIEAAKKAGKLSDGSALETADFIDNKFDSKQGLYALRKADLFNLLCIPPYKVVGDVDTSLIDAAIAYCQDHRAMLIIDPPDKWTSKDKAKDGLGSDVGSVSKNAAVFFPRLRQPNSLNDNQMEDFVPCGAVAGIFARTDTQRGVWKAPAGLAATLVGVPQLSVPLTDNENGELNPLGINCLRAMPAAGRVVWGSRTREGDDRLASEWKYISVRRTALFIEESLYRGIQWVVFEPNDEPLWAQIRLNVGAFMNSLFRQGAFQGSTPREAYFVKCDKETTTQNDIDRGIVNIVVGFAPLKPAEFVVLKIQQMAGQIQT